MPLGRQTRPQLCLFGPLRVVSGDDAVEVDGARSCAILARLALRSGEPVSIERLIDDVWGDLAPRHVRKSMSTLVSRLRPVVEQLDGTITHSGAGYTLRLPGPAVDIDAREDLLDLLRQDVLPDDDLADELLGACRGEPLQGIDAPYADAARVRLQERRDAVDDAVIDHLIRRGSLGAAARSLSEIIDDTPLREDRWARLIELYAALGLHDRAATASARATAVLRSEIGIEFAASPLDDTELIRLRLGRARSQLISHQTTDGISTAMQASAHARQLGHWSLAAEAELIAATQGIAASRPAAITLASSIEDVLPHVADTEIEAKLQLRLADLFVNVDDRRADAARDRAAELIERFDLPAAELDVLALRFLERDGADPDGCADRAAALLQRSDIASDPVLLATTSVFHQGALLRSGRFSEALGVTPRSHALAERAGMDHLALMAEAAEATIRLATEPLSRAGEATRSVGEWSAAGGLALSLALRFVHEVFVRRERCTLHELEPAVYVLSQSAEVTGLEEIGMACIELERGERDAARRRLAPIVAAGPQPFGRTWTTESLLCLLIEQADSAGIDVPIAFDEALAPAAGQVAGAPVLAVTFGRVARYLGIAARNRGDLDLAISRLEQSRTLDHDAGCLLWAGWAAHDEAVARRRRRCPGDTERADELNAEAGRLADWIGSERLRRAVSAAADRER